jgi:excisionase family DNA binding protein
VDLTNASADEVAFLRLLQRMRKQGASYFELERHAVGPRSPALRGGNHVDWSLIGTPLYLAARDVALRAGIEQGLILAPEHEALRRTIPTDGSYVSVLQAASRIGIPPETVHQAIAAGRLRARRFGNVWLVERESAAHYRAPALGRARTTAGRR